MYLDRTEFGFRILLFLLRVLGIRLFLRLYNLIASDTKRTRTGQVGGVKIPPFYDISHWKEVDDWEGMSPPPLLMGTKATQGTNYRDPTFIEYFQNFKDRLHCRRLAYHFFEKTLNPVQQADWFANYIRPYITDDDILCLDFEQGGETAPNLWAFTDHLHFLFPNNLVVFYSRKNLADPIVMNNTEKSFFKSHPFWTAGYPTDYTPYTTTPAGYIPDQTKWGPVWFWQYTDQAPVHGIVNGCDGNLIEAVAIEWLGETPPPPEGEDIVSHPYKGVTRTTGRRFNSDIYVTVIEPSFVRFHVAHEKPFDNGLLLVSQVCRQYDASMGWNGDEWNKNVPLPAYPKNIAYEDGTKYVGRVSAEPSLNIRNTGMPEIIHAVNGQEYNTSSGRRYLIENGVIKSYLSGTEPQYTERHPRGLTGLTVGGMVIMVTVDGRSDRSQGVTLKEGALILQEFGAHVAYDRGGGGDAVDVMEGTVMNIPCDTGTNGQPGVERAVPQAILIYAQEDQMSSYRYDATANGDGTRIRLDHNTAANYVNSYPRGTIFSGDELFVAPTDLSNANGVYQKTGDKWLKIVKINGQNPVNSSGQPITTPVWVAVLHMGTQQICTLVDNGGTPPPVDTLHVVATQGTERWEGDLPKV